VYCKVHWLLGNEACSTIAENARRVAS
jgi:hypothetical protein